MPAIELLLVSPPDYQTREFRGAQPLGIAYLAATLREQGNITCQLLDANAPAALGAGVGSPMSMDELTSRVVRFIETSKSAGGHPVIGFSAVSQVMRTCAQIAERIKAAHPDTLVIVGGYHPTFAHREILEDFPAIDMCVRGEGEQTLLEIMQRWQAPTPPARLDAVSWEGIRGVTYRDRQSGLIVANSSRPTQNDLDSIPFPARDLLPPLTAYPPYADTVAGKLRTKASIMSSRGCPFHCNFCSIITFYGDSGGKPWRGRSVENVVAEMIDLAERHGADHFEFQDDNFFVRPQRALHIVEAFAHTGHDFSFAFLTRADQIVRGESYFPALRRAGLRYVSVGIESGSEAALQRMVKETSVEINRRALQILHDNDVAAQVEFIMFDPGSTMADLQANLRFIEEQGLFGYFPPLIFGNLLLLPGTPAREQAEQRLGVGDGRQWRHEMLPYQFLDDHVAQVDALLRGFQRRLGDPWYELAFALLDGIPALELALAADGQTPAGQAELRRLAQSKLEFFALTRIPYSLLKQALDTLAAGQFVPADALLAKAQADLAAVKERLHLLRALPSAP